jgi:chromosome segregation ATPase
VNGYRLGNAGRAYNAVCPAATERAFRSAYNTGRDIYLARSRVNNTRSQIQQKQQAIQSLEADRQDRLMGIVERGVSSEQRVQLLYDVTTIEKTIRAANADIAALSRDLEQQQAELDSLRSSSPY